MPNQQFSERRVRLSGALMVGGVFGIGLGVLLSQFFASIHRMIPCGVGFAALFCGVLIGRRKLICSKCGRPVWAIGVDMSHCSKCGEPYWDPPAKLP
jgi:threonine/homoserine efflux transporter RhtA